MSQESGLMAHTCNPSTREVEEEDYKLKNLATFLLQRLGQEDFKFEAISHWVSVWDSVSEEMAQWAKALTRKPDAPRLIPGTEVKVEGQTTSTKLASHLHTCPTLKIMNKPKINLKTQNQQKRQIWLLWKIPVLLISHSVGNFQNDGKQKKLNSNFLFSNM